MLDSAFQPLMQRVQAALKEQLSRQNEKLEIDLREKVCTVESSWSWFENAKLCGYSYQNETLKDLQTERESLGVELYGIQQQLARQQMLLEQEQDTLTGLNQLRQQKEKTLSDVRQLYRNMQDQLKQERQQSKPTMGNLQTQRVLHFYASFGTQT